MYAEIGESMHAIAVFLILWFLAGVAKRLIIDAYRDLFTNGK